MEPADHDCPWREEVAELRAKLDIAMAAIAALERQVIGPKSEKMPPPSSELRRGESKEDAEARRLAGLEKRRQRAAQKQKLKQTTVVHRISDEQRRCPKCGGDADVALGVGKRTTLFEHVAAYFAREEHIQEKRACRCGQYIATAAPPARALDKCQYGPGFIAHAITMKCADSIPLHRLAKQYQRLGIPMARSTITRLFHGAWR